MVEHDFRIIRCPKCGGQYYKYSEHGVKLTYFGSFEDPTKDALVEVVFKDRPSNVVCLNCNARSNFKRVKGEERRRKKGEKLTRGGLENAERIQRNDPNERGSPPGSKMSKVGEKASGSVSIPGKAPTTKPFMPVKRPDEGGANL